MYQTDRGTLMQVAGEKQRACILVVDDEPTIAEIVARYLERAGYSTRTASDGPQALALAAQRPPDLVVLDLMLPGLDGLEVMRLLHEGSGERTPVVLLTAREFDLLLFFARHPGQVFTREQLMDAVWQYSFYTDTTTVTVHVRRLRAKIEPDPSQPLRVQTVWGVGYRFQP
jgi:DNA-binding response OmpR family regulator